MNKNGSIIFAILIIVVLTALGGAVMLRSVNENLVAKRASDSTTPMWVAEGGVQATLWQYNYNNCAGMTNSSTSAACTSCTVCTNKTLSGTLAGHGDYDVTLNDANAIIQSIGSAPNRAASNKILRRIQASVGRPQIFANGIFAQGQVTLSNNALVDSYNSNTGAYGAPGNTLSNGNVGSNGTTAGIINVNNNATVQGSVSTGPNGTVIVGNGATISGTTAHNNSISLPAVVVPTSLSGLTSSGTLSLGNGGSSTVNAGDYKYSNLNLSNNSTLTINGNVRLYLTGNQSLSTGNNVSINIAQGATLSVYSDGVFTVANNVTINALSQKPTQLQVYSTYTGANGVNINNNGTTYAAVYAPQTDIVMSNNIGLYGSVVGKTVLLNNNGEVHFDEALATMANPFEKYIATNWQEY